MSDESPPAPVRATARGSFALAAYIPLIAAGAVIPWIFCLFLGLIFSVGDTPYVNTPEKEEVLGYLSALPAVAGLIFGMVAIAMRLPRSAKQWVWLGIGILACAIWCYGCTHGYVR
jgi:hypothetical protein